MAEWVVSIEWLADHLESVTVVDVREHWEYDGIGHIPGAVNVPFDTFRTESGDTGMLPSESRWATLLGAAGITTTDHVIVYDDTHGVFAARFLLTGTVFGHEAISLLDGDFSAWQRRHPTETATPTVTTVEYETSGRRTDLLVDAEAVAQALEDSDTVVVDTRDPTEFEAGHLPGAVNLDWIDLVDQTNRGLRPPDELKATLESKGVTPDRRVVLYCNTARRLSHTFVVLKSLGFQDVVFYEGSLTDWLRRGRELQGTRAAELTVEDVQ